jgi:uncharacterized phage-associated protein
MFGSGRDLLVEAAALVLEGAGGWLYVTSLNKALFYADVRALLQTGKTITDTTYVALPAGPVVAQYKRRVVAALEAAGLAEQDDTDGSSKPLYLIGAPVRKRISEEQATILRRVGEWAKSKTATWLCEYSHENPGWTVAYETGLKAKLPAKLINLRIAMQQLVDEDDWMSGPDERSANALVAAENESGVTW